MLKHYYKKKSSFFYKIKKSTRIKQEIKVFASSSSTREVVEFASVFWMPRWKEYDHGQL